ncbi:MAG: 50S ribosomal protein L29 [Candidatus Doudnabacteria bacterium]|nr:50S ribosomal protein L29 [Candidatus Doudnabacteria bacterium]
MKFKELKNLSEGEVLKTLADLKQEAHDLSVKIRLNSQKNTKKLQAVKKDIARILTYLHSLKK